MGVVLGAIVGEGKLFLWAAEDAPNLQRGLRNLWRHVKVAAWQANAF
jgi:hypothetical protein